MIYQTNFLFLIINNIFSGCKEKSQASGQLTFKRLLYVTGVLV